MKKLLFLLLLVICASTAYAPRVFAENGFPDWPSFSITSATPPISISCSPSTAGRFMIHREDAADVIPSGIFSVSGYNAHPFLVDSPLCTGTLTITGAPTGEYLFFRTATGSDGEPVQYMKALHFDTTTDTLSDGDPGLLFSDGCENNETCIIEAIPNNNTIFPNTATTTGITMGAYWFVSAAHLDELNTIFTDASEKIRFSIQICPLNNFPDSTICWPGLIDWFLPTGFETSTSTLITQRSQFTLGQGINYMFTENTDYSMKISLVGSNYFNLFGPIFSVSTTTYFTIGSTTASQQTDGLSGVVSSTTLNNYNFDPFAVISNACNPFSGNFSVGDCVLGLIVPPDIVLQYDKQRLVEAYAHAGPFGYVTRMNEILKSNISTTTLSSISYEFASTSPFDYFGEIAFSPFESLSTTTGILNTKSDRDTPKSAWEITAPLINFGIYFFLLMMIISDLFKIHHDQVLTIHDSRGNTRLKYKNR